MFLPLFPPVLHPHHKLHYFKKAGWEEDWIETARDIVCAEFDQTYAFMDVNNNIPDLDTPRTAVHISQCLPQNVVPTVPSAPVIIIVF
jgi:hypothetical protein